MGQITKCTAEPGARAHYTDCEPGLRFQPLTLGDIGTLAPFFSSNPRRICDSTIGCTFMWRDFHSTEYAVCGGVLYFKAEYAPGVVAFSQPRGDISDAASVVAQIMDYCRAENIQPRLCAVSGRFLEEVRRLYPSAHMLADPAWSDYLYDAEDIKALAGRRYSGQRNHINKFTRAYPEWRFEPVNDANLARVRAFFADYAKEHVKDYPAYDEGNRKALEVIDNLARYGQFGGVLLVGDGDGEIAGAAFGETVGDTLFVHTEKALTRFEGAYPVLVREFARAFA
ncbi:MAG: phosphatidylglycerol lysyltransferase domain-containing protein, partial [Oscillospiraceae bacterium]|nr:phosphatidylglycerol lysyltransferase domain-containing protein [Oscillospiraceae bacterium]